MPTTRRLLLRSWVPYAVLATSVALTIAGTYYVVRTAAAQQELGFHAAADETQHLVELRLYNYTEVLLAGAALVEASGTVAQAEFREFITLLRIRERYPGIRGIGYAVRVPREQVAGDGRRRDRLQLDKIPVWPPGVRDEYTSIVYFEPMDEGNRAAIGYDMFTQPVRRAAMERARDTGEPTASGKVTLVQEIDEANQAGFLIYVPIYRKGAPTDTVDQRRRALVGYIYSPFRADDLLRAIFAGREGTLHVQVYDGLQATPAALLPYGSDPAVAAALRTTRSVTIAGRPWTIALGAQKPAALSRAAVATFAGGLLLSFALFGITLVQLRALEVAARHAAELRTSEEALRQSESRLRRLVVLEREARAEAQAANRAKDEFLATLSHELRTPLNAMLGWLKILRAGNVREERRANALEVIERNAQTQGQLIEDLLDVSRIITGKMRLELHPLQLGPVAQSVVDTLRPGAEAKQVQIHASIAPGPGTIMGDAARLQQIVWNLLSNAIKFTPPGGRIDIDVTPDGKDVELRVRDTGVGITPEFLPHVFERFRQADSSTSRAYSGVGLGLAIVRHLVELHGGTIEAHSEGRDRGAMFLVRFPVAARAAAATEARRSPDGTVVLDGVHVLVVDDDGDTRELLTEALSSAGARVTAADSAEAALDVLRHEGADVLVSDIAMPGVDGFALMRAVRELPGDTGRIPAIALTAFARPEDREHALDVGYQVHLPKPIELEALHESISILTVR